MSKEKIKKAGADAKKAAVKTKKSLGTSSTEALKIAKKAGSESRNTATKALKAEKKIALAEAKKMKTGAKKYYHQNREVSLAASGLASLAAIIVVSILSASVGWMLAKKEDNNNA